MIDNNLRILAIDVTHFNNMNYFGEKNNIKGSLSNASHLKQGKTSYERFGTKRPTQGTKRPALWYKTTRTLGMKQLTWIQVDLHWN